MVNNGVNKWVVICVFIFILTGLIISVYFNPENINDPKSKRGDNSNNREVLEVYAYCSDLVVCYYHPAGYAGGMGCFRDKDLVDKYCEGTT